MPTPYPFQTVGAEWLATRSTALLADEAGLGKTIIAIEAMKIVDPRHVLILCPAVVLWNWTDELHEWWPGQHVQVVSKGNTDLEADARVIVTTHRLLLNAKLRERLFARRPEVVVLDESHFFRGWRTASARHFYGLGGEGLVDHAERVWAMSATPMPKDASELWTMCNGLWPEQWGQTFHQFREHFCRTAWTRYGDNVKVVGNRNVEELRLGLRGKTMRRTKAEVLPELPPVRHHQVQLRPAKLPQEISALDGKMRPKAMKAVAEHSDPKAAFEALGEATDWSRYRLLCGLAKAEAVAELVDLELDSYALDRIVLFAHHREVVFDLFNRLKRFSPLTITGETSKRCRRDRVRLFQDVTSGHRVMICNLLAGGTGTTLTAAAEVGFVEMSTVPGENVQAADRIRRIGQTRDCRVRFFALAGTVDVVITRLLRRRVQAIKEVLE